jgi:hypothetical protein
VRRGEGDDLRGGVPEGVMGFSKGRGPDGNRDSEGDPGGDRDCDCDADIDREGDLRRRPVRSVASACRVTDWALQGDHFARRMMFPPSSLQYTEVASTAMATGFVSRARMVAAAAPVFGAFMMVPTVTESTQ